MLARATAKPSRRREALAAPAPWLLATLLDLVLTAIWAFAFGGTLRTPQALPQKD